MADHSSNLEPLLKSWGVDYDPTKVVGIALNTFDLDEDAARRACADAARDTGLPATDPVRFDAGVLVDAIAEAHARLQ